MWLPALGGAVLIIAGAYQFTRWKGICLRACRSPLAFLMQHDFGGGSRSAVRAGISHGAYCLGCCWADDGSDRGRPDELVWMVALFLVFLVEKVSPHGTAVARVVGIGLLLVGAAVIAHPTLMHALAGTPDPSTMGM